jgi:hypothetical protein
MISPAVAVTGVNQRSNPSLTGGKVSADDNTPLCLWPGS